MTLPNLYTKADGLEGTHVRWEDIEKAMQDEFSTQAMFGDKKSCINIGTGKGYLSTVCLINPDWQNVNNGEQLPDKFVAKLCTMLNILDVMTAFRGEETQEESYEYYAHKEVTTKKLHNCECDTYDLMKKYNRNTNVPMVKVFCTRQFTSENSLKGWILMEYLNNLYQPLLYADLTMEEVKQPLGALAKWSATSLKLNKEEREKFSIRPFADIFQSVYIPQAVRNLITKMKEFADGIFMKEATRLEEIIEDIHDFHYVDRIPDQLQMKPVFCHGDLWSFNVLWQKEGEKLKLASVVDYQCTHLGSPSIDIIRFISGVMNGKERQDNFEEIVRYYYQQFMEEIDEEEPPFTFEQLFESCKRFYPLGAFTIICVFPACFDMMFNDLEPEEKQKALDNYVSKSRHLYEDLFYYHQLEVTRQRLVKNSEKTNKGI